MTDKNFLRIGKVVGVHGLTGNVKVYSYAESAETFELGEELLVKRPGGQENRYKVNWAKPHKNVVLVSLDGVRDVGSAEALVGSVLFIDRRWLPELEEGTYYWFDLIGLSVEKTDGTYLGKIDEVIATGSNDVYVVKNKGSETLVPALESVVKSVNLEDGTMRVELPEGL